MNRGEAKGSVQRAAVLRPADSLVARKPQGLCVWVVRCFHPKHNKPCAQRAKGLHSLSSPLFLFSKMINLSVFVAAPSKFSCQFAAATEPEPSGEGEVKIFNYHLSMVIAVFGHCFSHS